MDQDRSSERRIRSLPDLAASVFSLILSLRSSSSYAGEGELRTRIAGYLEQLDREGREAGIAREDLEAAKYPLVAFVDETILNSSWQHRDAWRERPLQLDLYGETIAGERFFERLEKIRQGGDSKLHLLEIYYVCLALGFEGKYKLSGGDRLRVLTSEIRGQLGYADPDRERTPLSPSGRRSGYRSREEVGDALPIARIAAICAGGLVLLFVILWFLINHTESGALDALERLAPLRS
jgi:type VI secretion system protein ImpK